MFVYIYLLNGSRELWNSAMSPWMHYQNILLQEFQKPLRSCITLNSVGKIDISKQFATKQGTIINAIYNFVFYEHCFSITVPMNVVHMLNMSNIIKHNWEENKEWERQPAKPPLAFNCALRSLINFDLHNLWKVELQIKLYNFTTICYWNIPLPCFPSFMSGSDCHLYFSLQK